MPRPKTPVYWNGVWWDSLAEAASNCTPPVSPSTLLYRLKQGHTCDKDVQRTRQGKPFGGEASQAAFARKQGFSRQRAHQIKKREEKEDA